MLEVFVYNSFVAIVQNKKVVLITTHILSSNIAKNFSSVSLVMVFHLSFFDRSVTLLFVGVCFIAPINFWLLFLLL